MTRRMNRPRMILFLSVLAVFLSVTQLFAAEGEVGHHDPVAKVVLGLVVILLGAMLGGELFERIGQPSVLGELLIGVLIGNLDTMTGLHFFSGLRTDPIISTFAGVGVIILLFEVGLETKVSDMVKVGASATLVAVLGIITPMIFGFIVGLYLTPDASFNSHLFMGAIMVATSVGITARVLKDLKRIHTKESQIILGAAVIDDILGLIILAVVSGIVTSGTLSFGSVARISTVSVIFLAAAILVGPRFVRLFVSAVSNLRVKGVKMITALSFCFGLAYLADMIGLATIVGAFAAGLVLEEAVFEKMGQQKPLHDLLEPFTNFFVPIFFVLMGIQVHLETFANPNVLFMALAITAAAIVGKQACSLGVLGKGLDRISVGVGMIPRGEVGLIFASIGKGLGVVDEELFTASVMMVIVTTFMTPPLLKITLAMYDRRHR